MSLESKQENIATHTGNSYYKCWGGNTSFSKMNLVKSELNKDKLDSLMLISINRSDEIKNFDPNSVIMKWKSLKKKKIYR